ncbi:MAG TPA: lysine--tRNA ligase, partial [Flavobacteriales bacterium]|nr:lysine--tRNA ligase [Flavobacteriales bacterium]
MSTGLSEQEIVRRNALDELKAIGVNPYPAERFDVNTSSEEIKKEFIGNEDKFKQVAIAGRLMSRRIMGKASFAEIQDVHGRIQIYINRDEICPTEDKSLYNDVFKKLLDIGDIIGISGYVFTTQVGVIS